MTNKTIPSNLGYGIDAILLFLSTMFSFVIFYRHNSIEKYKEITSNYAPKSLNNSEIITKAKETSLLSLQVSVDNMLNMIGIVSIIGCVFLMIFSAAIVTKTNLYPDETKNLSKERSPVFINLFSRFIAILCIVTILLHYLVAISVDI